MDLQKGLLIVAIIVGVIVAVFIVHVALLLARAPGRIARERNHPSADAINLCGWLGLVFWPLWVVALIWAHSVPVPAPNPLSRDIV